eukprot:TRINITY_DN7204_c0_g1_i2.p3 TRINITY_DN7204_c0_g1~~TRINITY_DN7204_c0_g1_i2.p3  ORF type:complete len:183 (-),score=18.66 TRINITY_DN7204_c0_g1_i2:685-1233(-)
MRHLNAYRVCWLTLYTIEPLSITFQQQMKKLQLILQKFIYLKSIVKRSIRKWAPGENNERQADSKHIEQIVMKKILFIFILACISSKASIVNRDKEIINSKNVTIKQEKDSIIGTWNISRSISTKVKYKNGIKTKIESAFVYNVCPILVLKKDGTGVLINAVGDKSSFFWLINKEKNVFFVQ